ncbi:hypothetical protein N0V82_008415 [Gnomoniopsis sp. IMI 355080]|nr:hypothetical protein N0V82_008415 [Gnomoniopsis sp. IMI 355080]
MAVAAVNATAPAMSNADASMDADTKMLNGHTVVPKPRKFKASELPLPSSTRSAIEDLAHSFKKKGGYDETRKNVWETFESSESRDQILKAILEVAEAEIERNPTQLLTIERGKAVALIDGALDRTGVYKSAESMLQQLIPIGPIEEQIRKLRAADIGAEAAEAERIKGSKTDMDYAIDTATRRGERDKQYAELKSMEERIARQKREIAEMEERAQQKKREAERAAREEKRKQERDEREKQRQKEREERERERARERERSRARERSRPRERSRDRDRSRVRDRARSQDRRDRDRDRSRDRRARPRSRDRSRDRHRRRRSRDDSRGRHEKVKKELSKEELSRLEEEALADLLRDSKRVAAKQPELEVDEELKPPPRKTMPASAIQPIRRDSPKVAEVKKPVEAIPSKMKPEESTQSKSVKPAEGKATEDVKKPKAPEEVKIKEERKRSRTPTRHRSRSRHRGMPTTQKILEIREIDGPVAVGIAIRDAREADLHGETPDDDLGASPDLGETTTALSLDLDPADALQTELTAVRDHGLPSEDVQDRIHVRGDVPGPRHVRDPPRNPERENDRDHRAEDHEAPTEVSSELAPNLQSPRADSNDHPHTLMPRRRRRGSRSRWLRARKRQKRILPRKRKPVPRASLCPASILTSKNVLLWTGALTAAVIGLLRCDVVLQRKLIAMCLQAAVGDGAGPLAIETGGNLFAVTEAARPPDETTETGTETGTGTGTEIAIATAQGTALKTDGAVVLLGAGAALAIASGIHPETETAVAIAAVIVMCVVIGAATGETGRLDGTVGIGIAPPVGAARSGRYMLRIPLSERLGTDTGFSMV